jgi:hypothetical protein
LTLAATSGYLSQQKNGDRRKVNPDVKEKKWFIQRFVCVCSSFQKKKHTFAGLPLFWLTRFAPCSI